MFINQNYCIFILISTQFVPRGLTDKTISICSGNGLPPNRWQAFTWINVDKPTLGHMASLSDSEPEPWRVYFILRNMNMYKILCHSPTLKCHTELILMGLLPDTENCGLLMHQECRERFPRHRLQWKALVSDPSMHHGTCVTHVPWCMSGSLNRGGGENVPGIPAILHIC